MGQLNEISSKFHAHYMTKQNKQLKFEKEQLEKIKFDLVSFDMLKSFNFRMPLLKHCMTKMPSNRTN